MVPRWYQHGALTGGVLKDRKGPECTLGGLGPWRVYFKPKTVTLYFYFWRFSVSNPRGLSWGFCACPPPKKIPSRRNIEGFPKGYFAVCRG